MNIDDRFHIYVGNLPFALTSRELRELFEQHGEVAFAKIVEDKETKRSKGFGFVEMIKEAEAMSAIESLNNHSLKGREIVVNKAKPRPPRNN
jgi:RNA recognition motif-containing protein